MWTYFTNELIQLFCIREDFYMKWCSIIELYAFYCDVTKWRHWEAVWRLGGCSSPVTALSWLCLCLQRRGGWTARSRQKPGRSPWPSTATRSSTCRLTSPAANTSPASSRSDPRTKTHLPQTRQYLTRLRPSPLVFSIVEIAKLLRQTNRKNRCTLPCIVKRLFPLQTEKKRDVCGVQRVGPRQRIRWEFRLVY